MHAAADSHIIRQGAHPEPAMIENRAAPAAAKTMPKNEMKSGAMSAFAKIAASDFAQFAERVFSGRLSGEISIIKFYHELLFSAMCRFV